MSEIFDAYQILEFLEIENINLNLRDYGHLSDFLTGVNKDALLSDNPISEKDIYFQDDIGDEIKNKILDALEELRSRVV